MLFEKGTVETYSGRNEGWRLRPPYLAALNISGGTNRPKDTAMMIFIPLGGYINQSDRHLGTSINQTLIPRIP